MEEPRAKHMTNGTREVTTNKDKTHAAKAKHKKMRSGEPGARAKKTVYHWGNAEVLRWLKKYDQYNTLYSQVFQEHDLSGRALVRLNPIRMEKMGITNPDHRSDLLERILRLRLKHEQNELKILQSSQQQPSS
ncbi:protein aveugle-like [Patiria miniata]|uniref:SAM domain-containing protein n=1 Tax=Patiria miniata TaxID=46514 RepID=A0A913ZYX1_PATMI|nr:protein aveugle-like [Patiria miniata]XP_038056675.1 protein aveugle-like [Patiria miniata]